MATELVTLSNIISRGTSDLNFLKNGQPLSGHEDDTGPPTSVVSSISGSGVSLTVSTFFEGRLCQPEFRIMKDVQSLAKIVQNLGQTNLAPMQFVTISATDTTADYLEVKLLAGDAVTLTKAGVGSETLEIDINFKNSLELNLNSIQLINDETSPEGNNFYGTAADGTKGFQPILMGRSYFFSNL